MDNKTLDKLNKDLKNYSKSIGKVTDSFLSTLAECFPKMEERKKKTIWDLKNGDKIYFHVYKSMFGIAIENGEFDDSWEISFDRIYLSYDEAREAVSIQVAVSTIKKFIHDNNMEFEPDWDDRNQKKISIYYNTKRKVFELEHYWYNKFALMLPFLKTADDANRVITECNDELKIIFNIK